MKFAINLALILSIGLVTNLANAEILRGQEKSDSPTPTQADINRGIAKDVYDYFYTRTPITSEDLAKILLLNGNLRTNLAIVRTIDAKVLAEGNKPNGDTASNIKLIHLNRSFSDSAKDLGTGVQGFFFKKEIVTAGRLLLSPEVSAKMTDDNVVQLLYRVQMVKLAGIIPFSDIGVGSSALPPGTGFDSTNLIFRSEK